MAAIKVPARETVDYSIPAPAKGKRKTKMVQPEAHIRIPAAALRGVTVGGEATITLTGKVNSISMRQSVDKEDDWENESSLDFAMDTIEVNMGKVDNKAAIPPEPDNPFSDLIDEAEVD